MIPILYGEKTTNFNNQGIGSLSDAISCTVTEERNGIFELEMTYPVNGKHYEDISHSKIIKATPRPGGNDQLFRIYGITRPMNGVVTVNAEHISYQLSYIPVKTFEAGSLTEALSDLTSYVPTGVECPFTITSTMTSTTAYENRVVANIREKLGGSEGSILDVYGGEWEFDNYNVRLWENRGANRDVTLRYGKNITDITQEENIANTYTGAVGYYASGDGDYVETDVINTPSSSSYPFKRIEVVDLSSEFNEGAPDKEELTEGLQTYMAKHQYGIPQVSIKVSFVQLWQTEEYKDIAPLERVWLCDTINVQFEKLGISTTAKIVKVVYNVLLDRYDSIEVGETTPNLSDRVASQEIETKQEVTGTKNLLEQAIVRATDAITGQKGGYVVIDTNADGEPTQILIMDRPSKTAATKVWRWNLSGLGYSNHGVEGPFETAITANGEIVANFITAGELDANIIKAGLLKSIATQVVEGVNVPVFQLNIDTGAVKAYKLSVESPNFQLTEAGNVTATNVNLTGGMIKGLTGTGMSINLATGEIITKLFSLESNNIKVTDSTIRAINGGNETTITDADIKFKNQNVETGRIVPLVTKNGVSRLVFYYTDKLRIQYDDQNDTVRIDLSDNGIGLYANASPGASEVAIYGGYSPGVGISGAEISLGSGWGDLYIKVDDLYVRDAYGNDNQGWTGTINGVSDGNGHYGDIEVVNGIITNWSGWY